MSKLKPIKTTKPKKSKELIEKEAHLLGIALLLVIAHSLDI